MRTNIVLDEKLIKEALELSTSTTKKDLIHEALKLYIQFKKRKDIRDLKGKIRFSDDYDYKRSRVG
jgi:Arc/MetJ family transcription regulator